MEAQAWTRQISTPAPLTRKRRSRAPGPGRAGRARGTRPLLSELRGPMDVSPGALEARRGLGREAGAAWSAGRPRRRPSGASPGAAARPAGRRWPALARGELERLLAERAALTWLVAHLADLAATRLQSGTPDQHEFATARQDAAQRRHLEAVKAWPPCGGCPAGSGAARVSGTGRCRCPRWAETLRQGGSPAELARRGRAFPGRDPNP